MDAHRAADQSANDTEYRVRPGLPGVTVPCEQTDLYGECAVGGEGSHEASADAEACWQRRLPSSAPR